SDGCRFKSANVGIELLVKGQTSWDCTVRPDQRAGKRIEVMGNSRKEIAGLPDGSPDVQHTSSA
ncbi:MAG: hypothetical protein OEV08_07910, partial [Nitrospira sp.]|nr:hypothetical protein [Nitrospira sp.]